MIVTAPINSQFELPAGQALSVVADSVSSGIAFRLGDAAGGDQQGGTAIGASSTTIFGPYTSPTRWDVVPSAGFLTVTQGLPTGQQLLDALTGIAADTSGNLTAKTITTTGNSGTQITFSNGQVLIAMDTAITANSTTTSAAAGSLGITSHATGKGKLFMSDGTKWQFAVVA